MVSTRSGNEPLTTTSLAPSDSELFRGGYLAIVLVLLLREIVVDVLVALGWRKER